MFSLASMIIRDLDVVSVAVDESETNAPLVIDRYRILSLSIALEFMQPVAGRNPQIIQGRGMINIFEFSNRPSNDVRRKALRSAYHVQFLS